MWFKDASGFYQMDGKSSVRYAATPVKIKRAACLRPAQAAKPRALLTMLNEEPEGNDLALYIVSDRIYQALTIWLPM